MESFPFFFRIRTITFTTIMLFSFLWFVMLSVETFTRWSASDQISHSLMVLFVLTNTTTLILLPILILVQFRIWLDTARLFLLFILQVGSAVAGTYWTPKIQCLNQTPDDIGVCQLIGVYTMIACWVIPAILLFYSVFFAVMVYLQSRIPVVVEPKCHSGVDPEMGSTDSHSLWREKMNLKEIVGVQGSFTNASAPPRSLVLPTMAHAHTGQPSLPQSSGPYRQSTLPNTPRRQSTMPPLPHTGQQSLLTSRSVPSRHYSLPAFKHGNGPILRPSFTLSTPRPLATSASPSHPQTSPSPSHSYSTPSPASPQDQLSSFEPDVARSPGDHRERSKHLSMILMSSSPREMQNAEWSPTARSTQTKLSKPLPAHYL